MIITNTKGNVQSNHNLLLRGGSRRLSRRLGRRRRGTLRLDLASVGLVISSIWAATAKASATAKDRHALSAASAAKVALHRARIATAAVEAFDGMPRAPLLHALCARPLCPEYATEALPDLPPASAARLVRYLSVWLDAYSGGDGKDDATESPVDAATTPPEGLPVLREVVAWAGAVIDAHFTAFAMNVRAADDDAVGDDDAEAMATLRRAAARLQAGCASVGRVNGALVHVRDGAPLPENQGVQSSTYSIELVDW